MSVATNNLLNGKGQSPRKYSVNNFEQGYNSIDWSKGRVLTSISNKKSKSKEEIQTIDMNKNISDLQTILSATNGIEK